MMKVVLIGRLTNDCNKDTSVYHARQTATTGRETDDEPDGDHGHEE